MTDPGMRTRLGFLIPARNVTCEYEFTRAVPPGVSCHFSRLPRAQSALTSQSLLDMMESVEDAAAMLAGIDVKVVAAACTAGSFLEGKDAGDVVAVKASNGAGGVSAFTTTQAVRWSLRNLGARRIFMLTPYPQTITLAERDYFEAAGFTFSGHDTFDCEHTEDIRKLTSDDVLDRLKRHRAVIADADAVFISCTNLATMDRLVQMQSELGRPVLSSNSATLERALALAGLAQGAHGDLIPSRVHGARR